MSPLENKPMPPREDKPFVLTFEMGCGILAAVVFLAYGDSFSASFQFDDWFYLRGTDHIRDWSQFHEIWDSNPARFRPAELSATSPCATLVPSPDEPPA